jgi:hypothetical protein
VDRIAGVLCCEVLELVGGEVEMYEGTKGKAGAITRMSARPGVRVVRVVRVVRDRGVRDGGVVVRSARAANAMAGERLGWSNLDSRHQHLIQGASELLIMSSDVCSLGGIIEHEKRYRQ